MPFGSVFLRFGKDCVQFSHPHTQSGVLPCYYFLKNAVNHLEEKLDDDEEAASPKDTFLEDCDCLAAACASMVAQSANWGKTDTNRQRLEAAIDQGSLPEILREARAVA